MDKPRILIKEVQTGSIAEEAGILPGDFLLTINGESPEDIIDYQYLVADEEVTLVLESQNETVVIDIEKDYEDDLGMVFDFSSFSPIRTCENACDFCFVDQLPPHMRPSLYVKDDDYRFSIISGNFITLTNLTERDLERIIRMRLSPLHISVHATDPGIRTELMKNVKAGGILTDIARLANAQITMHIQIVLCPGRNDQDVLDETLRDLGEYWPWVRSIGIVPVGLTGYRTHLPALVSVDRVSANAIICQIDHWRQYFESTIEYPMVFLADEFFGKAGLQVPGRNYYMEFPQLDNGIGMVRLLLDRVRFDFETVPVPINHQTCLTWVTGTAAAPTILQVANTVSAATGMTIQVYPIENHFFGGEISVSGLLTGQDIAAGLSGKDLGKALLIPSSAVDDHGDYLLDDWKVSELSNRLKVPIYIADELGNDLKSILTAVAELE
jgi:putative radical SAM enzyme (TIGR03279 family)